MGKCKKWPKVVFLSKNLYNWLFVVLKVINFESHTIGAEGKIKNKLGQARFPAGIFDSGSVLLNQNVNGGVCTYVHVHIQDSFRIHSGFVRPWTDNIGSELVWTWYHACRVILLIQMSRFGAISLHLPSCAAKTYLQDFVGVIPKGGFHFLTLSLVWEISKTERY